VREVAGVFHSRQAIEAAFEDLLLNGFDRADIDRLASLDEVRRRLKIYVSPEEAADLTPTPRRPVFAPDDITAGVAVTGSLVGAAVGVAVVFIVLASGSEGWSAGVAGTLAGIGAGWIGGLLLARMFRRDQRLGLDRIEFDRGVVLWVRVRSAILRRNGGQAIRVHEIEIEKRTEDLPLSSLRPDPWLGSEPLGHP
jgi:hypothetical protein